MSRTREAMTNLIAAEKDDPFAGEKLSKLYLKFYSWATKLATSKTGPIAIQILDGMDQEEAG